MASGTSVPVAEILISDDDDEDVEEAELAMSDEEEAIGEILWYDCRTGEPKLSPEKLADTAWGDETGHAWTCVLGWPVQAAWRSDLERIRLTSVAWRSGLPFGVFGDDTGRVVVYPW